MIYLQIVDENDIEYINDPIRGLLTRFDGAASLWPPHKKFYAIGKDDLKQSEGFEKVREFNYQASFKNDII